MSESKYVGRSQLIVSAAKDAKTFKAFVQELFADDLRKAKKLADENLDYDAQLTIRALSAELGYKVPAKPIPAVAATKYTKKVEITFGPKASDDYRAFITKGVEKDGRFVSEKGDRVVFAFTPDKVERVVVRLKPLVHIMVTEIK